MPQFFYLSLHHSYTSLWGTPVDFKSVKVQYIQFHTLILTRQDFLELRILKLCRWFSISLYIAYMGAKVFGISGSPIWSKTLVELIFNSCGEFQWSPEGTVSQIHSLDLHVRDSEIFWDLLRSVQLLKIEWGAESSGKQTHLFTSRIGYCNLDSWVCGGRLAFGRTASLIPGLAVNDLPLSGTLWWLYIYIYIYIYIYEVHPKSMFFWPIKKTKVSISNIYYMI